MWETLFLVFLASACAQDSWTPVEGVPNAEFRSLPRIVNPAFLAPQPQFSVDLPKEPTELFIEIAETQKRFSYWYMGDDSVIDLFRFIAERTQTTVADILSLQRVKFGALGKAFVEVPFTVATKLKDVPLYAGDDLEVSYRSSIATDDLKVVPNPVGSEPSEMPGFFLVKVKLAGMKMFTVPVPRLARGSVLRGIVEDRAVLTGFTVELRKFTRDGNILEDADTISEQDNFFWASLAEKADSLTVVRNNPACPSGQLRILTNLGRAHFFSYDCHSTAGDVQLAMQNLGLLPDPNDSPYGIIVSTKGFFHTENVDTLSLSDNLVDHGAENNGVVFLTVACPTTTVFFVYRDKNLPQLLNCTTTVAYLAPIFNRIGGHDDSVQPKFTFLDKTYQTITLTPVFPVMQQLKNALRLIVNVDYPACDDNRGPATASPSPSPTNPGTPWDSEGERNAPAPANAIRLGDGTLLQQPMKVSAQEQLKHRRRV